VVKGKSALYVVSGAAWMGGNMKWPENYRWIDKTLAMIAIVIIGGAWLVAILLGLWFHFIG
jgi:hypothetical protein